MTRASVARYLESVQRRMASGQLTNEAAEDEVNKVVMRNTQDRAIYETAYKKAEDNGVSTQPEKFSEMLEEIIADLRSSSGGKRRRTRRGGNKDKGVTRIKEENGKWYIYVDDHKVEPGLDSFEKAKKVVESMKPSLAAYTLTQMKTKGGAYTIKKEGDRWYIYLNNKRSQSYDSFEKAKEALETAKASLTLANMKKTAGRKTRKNRKY